ncbi:Diacylglycerol kinase [uncultured Clostridium sp.]|uniref:YegS/Rv2252/BmrU family lipid kinase n=1 Tax=Muricoprocola aceti TaxID=2981772 RepID=A0ABT2SIZ8_9FIRM|nr:YegS/Rv2252/BmrU family lipid kinase [Muricoprocola aceti]MCI7226537.1 YegS/Rv2252/BmrU family lipid kinase [Lachnospiraceae bacterium]MCU6724468.1 YegS/Rv2252/BmrU family lipid kinase [Muricoprocola aceti]MDD7435182.1 YegS/Rv2252/BmrU family lipid kinase [Lachnospiraceae bacterium]SCH13367.1 Diacylglycerol kinase [uncultured Clostridium sp.]
MKKKVLFIVNPKSGKGSIRSKLLDIVDIFVKAEFDLTLYISQSAGDARAKAKEVEGRYELVICSGGDGTLDEVISGMMECEKRSAIGYIPCGSTNDFAHSLKIPTSMTKAAEHIAAWKEFPCDIGRFNDDYFVYIAAFGLFTDVSYETSQDVKNVLGHLAYILEGMKKLTEIKSYPMKVESEEMTVEGNFLFGMVTNSTSVGGFRNITGKHVHLDDGVFEVTLIKTPQNILELNEIIQAVIAGKSENNKYFYQFRSKAVKFISGDPVAWTLDGEFGGYHEVVDVKNDKQALSLLV